LLVLTLLAACGSKAAVSSGASGSPANTAGSAAPPNAPVRDYDDFCQRKAAAYCRRVAGCSPDASSEIELCASFTRYRFADPAQASCVPGSAAASAFDAASAARCLELTEQTYQGCQLARRDSDARSAAAQVCARVAPLALPGPGDICGKYDPSSLCSAPAGLVSDCVPYSEDFPARCGAAHPAAARGLACTLATPGSCAAGLTCVSHGPSVCAAPAADGAECFAGSDCASGSCSSEQRSLDDLGTCNAQPPRLGPATNARELAVDQYGLYIANAGSFWVNDRDIVWQTDDGKLKRAPKQGGGTPSSLPDQPFVPALLGVLDAAHLYLRSAPNVIRRIGLDAGEQLDWPIEFDVAALTASAAGGLVVAADGCKTVLRLDGAGSVAARATLPDVGPLENPNALSSTALAVHGDDVFCVNRSRVYRFAAGAASAEVRARLNAADVAAFFAFSESQAGNAKLWLRASNVNNETRLFTLAYDSTSLQEEPDASRQLRQPWLASSSEDRLYAFDAQGLQIWRSDAQTLEQRPVGLVSLGAPLAQDADFIYWNAQPALMRIAKRE
jgi:hypothetical protein